MFVTSGWDGLQARLVTIAALTFSLLFIAGTGRASANPADTDCWGETSRGAMEYTCGTDGSGSGGSDGGSDEGNGGGTDPSCDLSLVSDMENYWCEGENACWANIPSTVYPTEDTWPEEPPTEDSVYIFKYCFNSDGSQAYYGWGWYTPDEPSLEEAAQEAYGELTAPDFTLAFSPPGESVVYIDTWWWAEGAPDGNLKGTAALGVAAIAEPDHMEVDPGDGSGTITCDFVTTETDACTHVYEKASDGDGYTARARLIYDVHFEQNGENIEVANMPNTFESPWIEATVPVTEVQASVVR